MNVELARIELILVQIEHLAEELMADPDAHVRRSATELRAAFDARGAVEPAIARLLDSLRMLRRDNEEGLRRECRRRAPSVERLESVVAAQLLPRLRRIGFEV